MNKPAAPPKDDTGFLARWSQRKSNSSSGVVLASEGAAAPTSVSPTTDDAVPAPQTDSEPPPAPPPVTLDDVSALTGDSDFTRFVRHDVDGPVRNAALKKLFTDPHYNVMDGLDIYIDDYGRPDPLPASWLAKMAQSQFLGFFKEEDPTKAPPADATPDPAEPGTHLENSASDEDPDLRLQPDDAAAGPGAEPGTGEDPGREH